MKKNDFKEIVKEINKGKEEKAIMTFGSLLNNCIKCQSKNKCLNYNRCLDLSIGDLTINRINNCHKESNFKSI